MYGDDFIQEMIEGLQQMEKSVTDGCVKLVWLLKMTSLC